MGGCSSGSSAPRAQSALAREAPACTNTDPRTDFDCTLRGRFAEVERYLADRPGTVGVVVRDLRTGAVWRNKHAADLTWTASTIKLAMVVDLLTRDRAGEIELSAADRGLIRAMLHTSDDRAADTLWYRYAGTDHMSFNDNFPNYGLTSLKPQAGFTDFYPYWGFQKCTADDLDRLMTHVLTKLPADERAYIVKEMRSVDAVQRWGVWGAGPEAKPGTKDGWSEEEGGWVTNTVGFVGDGERYTLAVMNDLHGEAGFAAGRTTVTEVADLLFNDYFPG
ncbi:serine hydrolase [Actinophytocola sediminis]